MVNNHLREQLDNGIYLCELCIHERFSKAEKDEVGVCHETVSSDSRRVNLDKKSDRATNRALGYSHTRKPVLFKLREITREKYASTASRPSGDARTIELKI
jgi:hypothetical protein